MVAHQRPMLSPLLASVGGEAGDESGRQGGGPLWSCVFTEA